MAKCPVCRHPHLLDPRLLKERGEAWRKAYGNWRQGKVRGAAGETSSISRALSRTPRREELPPGETQLVRALDLALPLSKPNAAVAGLECTPPLVGKPGRALASCEPCEAEATSTSPSSSSASPTSSFSTSAGTSSMAWGSQAAPEVEYERDLEA